MQPTVSCDVHYYTASESGAPVGPLAATITKVDPRDSVGGLDAKGRMVKLEDRYDVYLTVLAPTPPWVSQHAKVPFSDQPEAGHWTWPPKV